MKLRTEFEAQLSDLEREIFRKSDTAYYIAYSEYLEERLEADQHETVVSSTVDFEDFKGAVLLLQRAYCAIEPKQDWGDGRIVDYKAFISEANKFVNEIRHKYKF